MHIYGTGAENLRREIEKSMVGRARVFLHQFARELMEEHASSPYHALLNFSTEVFRTRPVYMHRFVGNELYQCDVVVGEYTFRTTEAKGTLLEIEDDAANIALE